MPTAEMEAWEVACTEATQPDGTIDEARRGEVYKAEYEQRLAERKKKLMSDTRAVWRSMDGWARVESLEQWHEIVEKADDDIESGQFLIDRLGAEHYLDPELMAALLVLRRGLIDEYGAESAADVMLIDVAVISYYHTLRINGWIGNFSTMLEGDFFRKEGLSVIVDGQSRSAWNTKVKGLRVIELAERLGEQLMPLLDRSNRMMLRNLKALQARRQPPAPNVNIGNAGQVNVAAQQVNATGQGGGAGDPGGGHPTSPRESRRRAR
jgi:hypothetical protein